LVHPASPASIGALASLLSLAVFACTDREPADASATAPRNVVLLTLDTTRADALGAYGQELPVSPRIDAMAAQGVLFEQAMTVAPNTLGWRAVPSRGGA